MGGSDFIQAMNVLEVTRAIFSTNLDRTPKIFKFRLDNVDFSRLGSSIDESFEKIPAAFDEIISNLLGKYSDSPSMTRFTLIIKHRSLFARVSFLNRTIATINGKEILDYLKTIGTLDISKPFTIKLHVLYPQLG